MINSATDKSAAITAFEKSISIEPNFAMSRRDYGMLQFHQQNYSEAVAQLAKAIQLGMKAPTLHNFLGIAYSRTNRLQQAVASYREALKLDPNLAEAHLNIVYAYQRLGRLPSGESGIQNSLQPGREVLQVCIGTVVPRGQAGRRSSLLSGRLPLEAVQHLFSLWAEGIAGRSLQEH